MSLSMKVLGMEYLNHSGEFEISENSPDKNIGNLNIKLINQGITDVLEITWTDCSNPNWTSNVIVKGKDCIPISPHDGDTFTTSFTKNQYSINPYKDLNIQENTLYCFRIFSQFDNETKFYSGFKNIFFVYVFDDLSEINFSKAVPANIVLQTSTHKFVNDIQIANWDKQEIVVSKTPPDDKNLIWIDIKN